MEKKMRKIKIRNIIYVLTSIAAVSIIAIVFFFWGVNSAEKKQYESQIKQEAQAFTDNLISELDQVKTSGPAAGTEKQTDSEEPAKPDDARKQQVLQTLTAAYSKAFNEQKSEALSIATRLIEEGKADWAELEAKGENTAANKAKLASEYLAKADAAEAQMDASFYALTDKMKAQLKEEGIDSTNIIAEYEEEYKKTKVQYKKEMMDKAMAAIN
jgi:nitrogen fixation-related uncharacterized protein